MIWVKFCGYSDLFFLFSRVGRQAFSAREAHSKDPTPNVVNARIFQKALALNAIYKPSSRRISISKNSLIHGIRPGKDPYIILDTRWNTLTQISKAT